MTRGGKGVSPEEVLVLTKSIPYRARYASIISVGAPTRPGSGPDIHVAMATREADAHERGHPFIAHERPTATVVTAQHAGSAQHIAAQIRREKDPVDRSILTNTITRLRLAPVRKPSYLLADPGPIYEKAARRQRPIVVTYCERMRVLDTRLIGALACALATTLRHVPCVAIASSAWSVLAVAAGDTGDPARHDTRGSHHRRTGKPDSVYDPPIFRTKIYQ